MQVTVSDEHLRDLFFQGAPYGILIASSDGVVLAANPRAAELAGRSRDELIDAKLACLFSPEEVMRTRLDPEKLRVEALSSFPCNLLRDGSVVATISLSAWLLGDNQIAMTLRPSVSPAEVDYQAGSSASRDEMQSILSTIPHFVLRVGLDGAVKYINRTKRGVTIDQLIGTNVTSWVRAEDRERFQKIIHDACSGIPGAVDCRYGGDPRARYVTRVAPVVENGRVTSLIVVGEDVTERKLAEERFRSVIEASPVPFALNDGRENITYLNPEFVRVFGYTLEDIPTLNDWWPRAYPDPTYRESVIAEWGERLERARTSGESFEPMEIEIRAKDGSRRFALASAAALTEAFAGTHLVALVDVTKAKELEAERRKLEERLAQAQRLQSIGRLAGGVAHDNNNMLSVIVNHADMALRSLTPSDRLYADLWAIREAAERCVNLTKQLLVRPRQQPIAPVVLDLGETARRAVALLDRLLGERISAAVQASSGLWPVRVDPTQVEQILANLCINARDAMGGAGQIAVAVENVVWSDEQARANGNSTPGDYVVLSVKDQGCGMSPEVLERAFEPFFTTKPPGEGTGLGLATVHGLVEQNNGFILVESAVGLGSTFRVHLPKHGK